MMRLTSTSILIHRYVFDVGDFVHYADICKAIDRTRSEVSKRINHLVVTDRLRRHPTEKLMVGPGHIRPKEVDETKVKTNEIVHSGCVKKMGDMEIGTLYALSTDGPVKRRSLDELVLCDGERPQELTAILQTLAHAFYVKMDSMKRWTITERGRRAIEIYESLESGREAS